MKKLLSFAAVALLTLLLVFALEGAASFVNIARQMRAPSPTITTTYDAQIGWVGIANLKLENTYGPGKHYHSNEFGLRRTRSQVAPNTTSTLKVVCSGDSFTQGDQVDDFETWCSRLQDAESRIHSVNFAQAGYSPDQSLLYYQRFSQMYEHQVHLLAITGPSFVRIVDSSFNNKLKPYLVKNETGLNFQGSPVKKIETGPRFLTNLASADLSNLQLWRIFQRFTSPKETEKRHSLSVPATEIGKLGGELLEEYKKIADAKNIKFVVIYLPTYQDFYNALHTDLRATLESETKNRGIEYWDLGSAIQKYSLQEISEGGGGHYKQQVYVGIADEVAQRLMKSSNLLN